MGTNTPSLQIPSSIKETASEDGGVLLDIDRGICFSLNSVGLTIWQSLKQGRTVDEIVEILQGEYSVSREQLTGDVRTFLESLQSSGLVAHEYAPKTAGLFRRFWGRRSA
ncbi:MAG TPA: PqqD family protein [Candidatus Angelobacter sp.]|nr:PqqD family protein [Candidatus Angelobacter sp.]